MQASKRYQLLKTLGSSNNHSVFQAFDTTLQRKVTVKRLAKTELSNSEDQRLLCEAKALASIKHPNIVSIYDVLNDETGSEIIMEPIKGIRLHDLTKKHLLIGFDLKVIALQLLKALAAAHNAGVIHSNLTPKNIRLTMTCEGNYNAKLYGFGKSLCNSQANPAAPELLDGGEHTIQSDLYALGCVFHYLLTGALPINSDNFEQTQHSLSQVRCDLEPKLIHWINLLKSPIPEQRPQNCADAIQKLAEINLTQNDQEFTVPADLILSSKSSRTVRPISVESLTHKISDTSLTAQIPSVEQDENTPTSSNVHLDMPPTNCEVTHAAEWFFNVKGVVKGPLELEQLQHLCREGKVQKSHLIWHPYSGEWVKAENCDEITQHLAHPQKSLTRLSSRCITKPSSADQFRLLGPNQGEKSSIFCELFIVLTGATATAAAAYLSPDSLHLIVAGYALLLVLAGLLYSKIQQYKSGKSWLALCFLFPLVGDLLHAIVRPSAKSTLGALMLLTGSIYLGYFSMNQMNSLSQDSDIVKSTELTSMITTSTTLLATKETK